MVWPNPHASTQLFLEKHHVEQRQANGFGGALKIRTGAGAGVRARQVDTDERAKRDASIMSDQYAGVLAWSRDTDPAIGNTAVDRDLAGRRTIGSGGKVLRRGRRQQRSPET
jgi:hypothetical protein